MTFPGAWANCFCVGAGKDHQHTKAAYLTLLKSSQQIVMLRAFSFTIRNAGDTMREIAANSVIRALTKSS